jgi:hypothetical protein
MDIDAVQGHDQPAFYLLPPHAGRQVAGVVYAACFEPPSDIDLFMRPERTRGSLASPGVDATGTHTSTRGSRSSS